MNADKLLQYMSGYVNITIEGYYIEKFINICSNKNIVLWNLKRENSIILHASIHVADFKLLKRICKDTKCKVKIEKKKGFPFILKKYKKRKMFIVLLVVSIVIIIGLSNFVWNIDVEGTQKISKQDILDLAEIEGLTIGKFKGKIDTKEVIDKIRLERDDIAWVGVEIKGTNAIIKVAEADNKPEIINDEEYCNIVASKDGIIKKISAQNGTPLVKEGDVVKKGDVIIEGVFRGKYTGDRYAHAQGEVQAIVWYTNTQKVKLKDTQKMETGALETKHCIKLNNFQINFNKSVPKFEKYDTIEAGKKLKLFSNFYLPIELLEYTYKEYREVVVIHSIEEAKQIGIDRAKQELAENIKDKEILDTQINTKSESDAIIVEVTYEVKENIGVEEKMVF